MSLGWLLPPDLNSIIIIPDKVVALVCAGRVCEANVYRDIFRSRKGLLWERVTSSFPGMLVAP